MSDPDDNGLSYVAETALRAMMLELINRKAQSCRALELHMLPGPFRPRNWRIGKLDVLVEDYGRARDEADRQEAMRHWIMVPDGHVLAGEVYGTERSIDR